LDWMAKPPGVATSSRVAAVLDPPLIRPRGGQWTTGHADLEAGGAAANRHGI
jgi:hypothetical protein